LEVPLHIPASVLPALAKAAIAHSLPLEFWQSANGNRIMACFSTLAEELLMLDFDLVNLPAGYRLVSLLFRWEDECQSEGWNAFAWTPHMDQIIRAYFEVQLDEEAAAISRAAAAWATDNTDLAAIDAAYRDGPNRYPVDLDRYEYLVDHFCEKADGLFYEK
jgi:hypothetical protein